MRVFTPFLPLIFASLTVRSQARCNENWLESLRIEGIRRREVGQNSKFFHLEEFRYYNVYSVCKDTFFALNRVQEMAQNLISFQHPIYGGWDKHNQHDGFTANTTGEYGLGTIDNGQTTGHIWFLARAQFVLSESSPRKLKIQKAIEKGLTQYLFKTQYENGGLPQTYPDRPDYKRFIKINQNSMVLALDIFRAIANGNSYFEFLPEDIKLEARRRHLLGRDFLLKAQILQNGNRTGWAQQYEGYTPVGARSFELPGIASRETLGVINFFLADYAQNTEIKNAVDSAVRWLEDVAFKDVELLRPKDSQESCKSILGARTWTRFYDIQTKRPFFAGRSKDWKHPKKYTSGDSTWGPHGLCETWRTFREREPERADGYAWFLSGESDILDRYYALKP